MIINKILPYIISIVFILPLYYDGKVSSVYKDLIQNNQKQPYMINEHIRDEASFNTKIIEERNNQKRPQYIEVD